MADSVEFGGAAGAFDGHVFVEDGVVVEEVEVVAECAVGGPGWGGAVAACGITLYIAGLISRRRFCVDIV